MKKRTYIGLVMGLTLALLTGLAPQAGAADRYWIATSAANWNNTANWSLSSGGTGNAGVPGAGDVAIFDGAGGANGDCNIDATVSQTTGGGFNIGSGYSGTISQGAVTITVGSTGWTQAGGTFNGGSNPININGPVALSGGTFTSTSGTLTLNAATWTSNTGTPTFNANGGKVVLSRAIYVSMTVASGNIHFNNVDLSFEDNGRLTVTGSMYVDGALQVVNRSFKNNHLLSGTIQLAGNLTVASLGSASINGTIRMIGTGNQTISSSAAGVLPTIEVDKASGTLILSGVNYAGKWTWTNGTTLDATGSTLVIYPPDNTPVTVTPGTVSYNNVSIRVSQGGTIVTISGTWDVNGNYSPAIRDQYGSCKINTGTINVAGNLTVTYGGSGGWGASTCAIVMDGTGSVSAPSGIPCASLTLNTSGTVSLAGNVSHSSLTWTSGALNLSSNTLTLSGAATIAAGATTLGVTVAGGSPTNGRLTCSSTVTGIANAGLAVEVTAAKAESPVIQAQTYTILSNNTALGAEFESVTWGGDWRGTVNYSTNSGKNVTLSNVRLVPGGTVLVVQ